MGPFGAASKPPDKLSLEKVKECDIFVQILDKTITLIIENEYNTAKRNNKPILVFVKKEECRDPELIDYIENLKGIVTYKEFSTSEEFRKDLTWALLDEVERITLPFVNISSPKNKDEVLERCVVEGSSSATKDSGLHVYVLIWSIEGSDGWWVQPTTTCSDGRWRSNAYIGSDHTSYPKDIRYTYRIVAIITMQELKSREKFAELPDSVTQSREIIVIRAD